MAIKSRTVSAGYKLALGALASVSLVTIFRTRGLEAWRLFDTWVLLLMAIYFVAMSLAIIIWRKRPLEKFYSPMWEGMIIVSSLSLLLLWMVYHANLWAWPALEDQGTILANVLLPVFVLVDWVAFSTKGRMSWADPWNWLALPVIFTGALLLLFGFAFQDLPYAFLNFRENGTENLFWWMLVMAVVELSIGYLLVVLDHLSGGKISQRIVMPKIKTVVIVEELPDDEFEQEEQRQVENNTDRKAAKGLHSAHKTIRTTAPRLNRQAGIVQSVTKPKTDTKPESNIGSKAEVESKAEVRMRTETKPRVEAKPRSRTELKVGVKPKPDAKPTNKDQKSLDK